MGASMRNGDYKTDEQMNEALRGTEMVREADAQFLPVFLPEIDPMDPEERALEGGEKTMVMAVRLFNDAESLAKVVAAGLKVFTASFQPDGVATAEEMQLLRLDSPKFWTACKQLSEAQLLPFFPDQPDKGKGKGPKPSIAPKLAGALAQGLLSYPTYSSFMNPNHPANGAKEVGFAVAGGLLKALGVMEAIAPIFIYRNNNVIIKYHRVQPMWGINEGGAFQDKKFSWNADYIAAKTDWVWTVSTKNLNARFPKNEILKLGHRRNGAKEYVIAPWNPTHATDPKVSILEASFVGDYTTVRNADFEACHLLLDSKVPAGLMEFAAAEARK